MLAGVSVDYYARLERGSLEGVSDEVLGSIARTLELDEAETAHLFDLARAVRQAAVPRRRPSQAQHVRPSVQRLLDGWVGVPAWVRNERMDVAANPLGRALYSELFASTEPGRAPNNARFVFLDPRSREFYPEWEQGANDPSPSFAAARTQPPRPVTELIGELSTRSDEFRTRWANHNVRFTAPARRHLHHPVVGDLGCVRGDGAARRPRPHDVRLHRARLADGGAAEAPRELGGDARRRGRRCRGIRSTDLTRRCGTERRRMARGRVRPSRVRGADERYAARRQGLECRAVRSIRDDPRDGVEREHLERRGRTDLLRAREHVGVAGARGEARFIAASSRSPVVRPASACTPVTPSRNRSALRCDAASTPSRHRRPSSAGRGARR